VNQHQGEFRDILIKGFTCGLSAASAGSPDHRDVR